MKKAFLIIMLFLLLPQTSSVLLDSGTVLNTSVSNSSMTFIACSVNTDEALVEDTSITLTNNTFIPEFALFTFPNPIVWDEENTNVDCGEFAGQFGTNVACTSGNLGIFRLILIMFALAIIVIPLFILVKKFKLGEASVGNFIVAFIGIMVGLALLIATAQQLGSICVL